MFDFYLQAEYWLAAAQLALAMLGMGATLRPRDFMAELRTPRALVYGIIIQMAAVPAIAALLIALLPLAPGVAAGLALCAVIPGGTMSNVFTFVGRGNAAMSIALTGVTTLACMVTTPILLKLMIADLMPSNFSMPVASMAQEIGLALLVPLLVGMVVRFSLPTIAETFSRYCIRASLFCIGLIVIGAMGSGRVDLAAFGITNLGVVILFLALLAGSSWLLPKLAGLQRPDITAINVEVTVRNGNLGVLLAASLFPATAAEASAMGAMVMFTVLIYGGAALLVGIGLVRLHRRLNSDLALDYPLGQQD